MYGRGFGNNQDNDILASITKSPGASKSISFAQREEDDLYGSRRNINSFPNKTTSNFSQNSVVRKRVDEKKASDDVDDLLSLITGTKADNTGILKKPPLPNKQAGSPTRPYQDYGDTGNNKFLEEFMDEEPANSVYVPFTREDRSKKSVTSEDYNKKRGALFGLSNEPSLTQTQSLDQGPSNFRNRPQTTETRAGGMGMGDSEIGEINLTVSRRGGRAKARERPFTSPGTLEKPESQGSEERSIAGETPGLGRRSQKGDFLEEDGDSDYFSGIGNRDRVDSKKSLTPMGGAGGYAMSDAGRKDYLRVDNAGMDGTPRKSPASEYGQSREQFYPQSQNTLDDNKRDFAYARQQPIKRDFLDTASQLMSHTSQAGSITNVGGGIGGRRNRADTGGSRLDDPVVNKMEDDIANLVKMQTAPVGRTTMGGGLPPHIQVGTPMRDASILIQEGLDPRGPYVVPQDTITKDYLKETEEFYKRRMKDAEEYYNKRYEDLKKALEEEKKKWEESYTKEIELLKKEKDELKESVKTQVERERDRMKEIFSLELESKDKLHKYELERQRHLLEEQNESLKRQLEAQTRLNSLADEVRTSSNKLMSLTDKLEQDKNKDGFGKQHEYAERERRVAEGEIKLKHEQTLWESEKKRLEKLRKELEDREAEVQKTLEKEREMLRKEYQRLTELQDSIRDQEVETKRKLDNERKAWEQEKAKLEKENAQIKEEYRDKYGQLELQTELLDTHKREFEDMIERSEQALRQKHEEVDSIRKRMTIQEAEILRRTKILEHKEMISRKEIDEVQSKLSYLEMERVSLEKERMDMRDAIQRAREDAEAVTRFRKEYELEKDKNTKLKLELDGITRNFYNGQEKLTDEKNKLGLLQKTLEDLRYNYVKTLAIPEPKTFGSTTVEPGLAGLLGKENQDPFGFRKTGTMLDFTEGLVQKSRSPGRGGSRALSQTSKPVYEPVVSRPVGLREARNEQTMGRTGPKNSGSTGGAPKETGGEKVPVAKPFNYKGFMDQLKQYEGVTSNNQNYIAMEKEGLMKNKIDLVGTGSLMRLKSLGNTDSSLKSSPKFKNSIGFNKYDRVEDL